MTRFTKSIIWLGDWSSQSIENHRWDKAMGGLIPL
jgi:hypothetical protein